MPHTLQNEPLNIMLADDDADERYFFEEALLVLPIATNLKTVPDGERLMNYLSIHSGHLPDVLFLDINMPRKNGIECLKEIKCNEKLKQIPVIIYSTFFGDENVNSYYQNGANDFLRKGSFSELEKCFEKILTLLAKKLPSRYKFMTSL